MTATEIVPYLSVTNAREAVAYYSRVFETAPALLLNMPDGRVMHCEFRVGAARFFLNEELPEHGGTPSPANLGRCYERCDPLVRGGLRRNGRSNDGTRRAGSYASNGHVLGRKICADP
jgi:hypothetical protein